MPLEPNPSSATTHPPSSPAEDCQPPAGGPLCSKPLCFPEILVPTDFSECANYALKYAMSVARQHNSRLTLLHVIEPPTVSADVFYQTAVNPTPISLAAEQAIARTWEQEKPVQPPQWRSMVCEGIPYQVIIQVAENEASDLIIMATHGRKGLARVFAGGTAEKVIRQAPCPVLVVRPTQNRP